MHKAPHFRPITARRRPAAPDAGELPSGTSRANAPLRPRVVLRLPELEQPENLCETDQKARDERDRQRKGPEPRAEGFARSWIRVEPADEHWPKASPPGTAPSRAGWLRSVWGFLQEPKVLLAGLVVLFLQLAALLIFNKPADSVVPQTEPAPRWAAPRSTAPRDGSATTPVDQGRPIESARPLVRPQEEPTRLIPPPASPTASDGPVLPPASGPGAPNPPDLPARTASAARGSPPAGSPVPDYRTAALPGTPPPANEAADRSARRPGVATIQGIEPLAERRPLTTDRPSQP